MNTSATNVAGLRKYRGRMVTAPNQSVAKLQWVVYGQHQQLNLMAAVSTQQEDRMNTVQSWKEVIELHHAELDKDYPEDLWVDPAEINYDSKEDSSEATGTSSLS